MPAKTAPARYEFISPSLKREDLGDITAPFRIKGVLGISDKFVYNKRIIVKEYMIECPFDQNGHSSSPIVGLLSKFSDCSSPLRLGSQIL